jgi:hypothetical protein
VKKGHGDGEIGGNKDREIEKKRWGDRVKKRMGRWGEVNEDREMERKGEMGERKRYDREN